MSEWRRFWLALALAAVGAGLGVWSLAWHELALPLACLVALTASLTCLCSLAYDVLLRARQDRRARLEAAEPYDDRPLCPGCWVRFPNPGALAAHMWSDQACGRS